MMKKHYCEWDDVDALSKDLKKALKKSQEQTEVLQELCAAVEGLKFCTFDDSSDDDVNWVKKSKKKTPADDPVTVKLNELVPYIQDNFIKHPLSRANNEDDFRFGDYIKYTNRWKRNTKGYVIGHTKKWVWVVEGDLFGERGKLKAQKKRSNLVIKIQSTQDRQL